MKFKYYNAEEFFEWFVEKTIWFYLPFYAMWRLTKELLEDIFPPQEQK